MPHFPPVPSNGHDSVLDLGGQVGGTHIRPIRQVLPLVDAWNATVQHQLTNSITCEVAYVGSKGTHGFAGDGPNYDVNPRLGPEQTWWCNPANPDTTNTGIHRARRRIRVATVPNIPFDLGNYYGNDAGSTYNAFEAKVEKRFTQGLQFITHYTFSHANGYDSNYYAINHSVAWGPVDFNRNQVWVLNTVYELPFGKGKSYLGNASKAENYLVGGWQMSNTTNWSSGLPWTPSFGECGSEEDVGVCRPNKGNGSFHTGLGSLDPVAHTITYYTPVANIVTNARSLRRSGKRPLGQHRQERLPWAGGVLL